LETWLHNESVVKLVSQMASVPSLPSLYQDIMRELQVADTPIEQVGLIIGRDVGMTAKMLQLVNSAFFGSRRRISCASDAVFLLGIETIKSLVLAMQVFSNYPQKQLANFSIEEFTRHSLATGLLAAEIAKTETGDTKLRDEAWTAGLLHDIGKLILEANHPELCRQVLALAQEKSIPRWQSERELIGASHGEVGAYLLGLWGLPMEIAEAVALHNCPIETTPRGFSPMRAVYRANLLEHENQRKNAPPECGVPAKTSLVEPTKDDRIATLT
jgi:putative nucleotidyltransferase with HDIG domain